MNASARQFAGRLLRRLLNSLLILLGIALLCLLGLYLSDLGRRGMPVEPLAAARAVGESLFNYLFQHPTSYFWKKQTVPAFTLVADLFVKSAGLLVLSLLLATAAGGLLGILAAQTRRRNLRPLVLFAAVTGVSIPSFLLAMVLWVLDFRFYRLLGLKTALLPPTGTGWDLHIVMPALVLAARPAAQIMQVTYIFLSEGLQEEYVRVARAKGVANRHLLSRHLLRNLLIPLLTTMGASLRFSLASLPVVESFFLWEGVGLAILQALELGMPYLITDLVVALGLLFLFINLVLEFLYPLIDPRIRSLREEQSWSESESEEATGSLLAGITAGLRARLRALRALPARRAAQPVPAALPVLRPAGRQNLDSQPAYHSSTRQTLLAALTNLPLLLGGAMALGLVFLAVWGGNLTSANPYETHDLMTIAGKISAPPFEPSEAFPWGSDPVGRDVRALVLHGARQTLTLALLATLARAALGAVLGIFSGWWRGGWFDRLVQSLSGIWAAFPETIFAMIVILALGIQRGRSVFIAALCVVGWGQIAQFTRSQVISLKPRLFVEAARSTGARPDQILVRHILPFLVSPLLVLLALEMGGVLMLLAELGFLNIFMGGGFRAMIGEAANMVPVFFYFSDVPEWGALLANIRSWWRSYGWLAWYPGMFFFLSILTFNLFGEGLRRFFQEARLNLHRFLNRYTLLALLAAAFGLNWLIQTGAPIHLYASQARQFDPLRALLVTTELASPKYQGRLSGSQGGMQAAEYIAAQMKEIGLFPANRDSYIYNFQAVYNDLTGQPELALLDPRGGLLADQPTYGVDYKEYTRLPARMGCGSGNVAGLVLGEGSEKYQQGRTKQIDLMLQHMVVLMRASDYQKTFLPNMAGVLVVDEEHPISARYSLFTEPSLGFSPFMIPTMQVSPELAERLLAPSGSSLADMERLSAETPPDQLALTPMGEAVRFCLPGEDHELSIPVVAGVLPGTGAALGVDDQAILVTAHYDGLGVSPDGTLYPGANDNASGVGTMLEIARALKNGTYPPEKTVVFVAWAPGERGQGFSLVNVMNALPGLSSFSPETVIELTGVGAGEGRSIYLAEGSSFRLVKLFQKAAAEVDASVTNRGRDAHFGLYQQQGFGERRAASVFVSWDESDIHVHTPMDVPEQISGEKLRQTGQTVTLVVSVLAREENY